MSRFWLHCTHRHDAHMLMAKVLATLDHCSLRVLTAGVAALKTGDFQRNLLLLEGEQGDGQQALDRLKGEEGLRALRLMPMDFALDGADVALCVVASARPLPPGTFARLLLTEQLTQPLADTGLILDSVQIPDRVRDSADYVTLALVPAGEARAIAEGLDAPNGMVVVEPVEWMAPAA